MRSARLVHHSTIFALNRVESYRGKVRTMKTAAGLVVNATLLDGEYRTGITVSDAQMEKVNSREHGIPPMWTSFGPQGQAMNKIIFVVANSPQSAHMAKAAGESILTEADTLDELQERIFG